MYTKKSIFNYRVNIYQNLHQFAAIPHDLIVEFSLLRSGPLLLFIGLTLLLLRIPQTVFDKTSGCLGVDHRPNGAMLQKVFVAQHCRPDS